jgi:hypothetical protein
LFDRIAEPTAERRRMPPIVCCWPLGVMVAMSITAVTRGARCAEHAHPQL